MDTRTAQFLCNFTFYNCIIGFCTYFFFFFFDDFFWKFACVGILFVCMPWPWLLVIALERPNFHASLPFRTAELVFVHISFFFFFGVFFFEIRMFWNTICLHALAMAFGHRVALSVTQNNILP